MSMNVFIQNPRVKTIFILLFAACIAVTYFTLTFVKQVKDNEGGVMSILGVEMYEFRPNMPENNPESLKTRFKSTETLFPFVLFFFAAAIVLAYMLGSALGEGGGGSSYGYYPQSNATTALVPTSQPTWIYVGDNPEIRGGRLIFRDMVIPRGRIKRFFPSTQIQSGFYIKAADDGCMGLVVSSTPENVAFVKKNL